MAQQEEGWPLGLQPLNVRVGFARNVEFSGSGSFNTLLTGSPMSSTDSSSDLDTESTGSFFHDKSITLGSLMGVSSISELSRKSSKKRKAEVVKENKKSQRPTTWFFSLCSRDNTDAETVNNPPSLGHFLAVERRAANECRRHHQGPAAIYGVVDEVISLTQPVVESNSLFVDGHVAPPGLGTLCDPDSEIRKNGRGNGHGVQVLLSCMFGQPSQ